MHKIIKKMCSLFIVLSSATINYVNADQSIQESPKVSQTPLTWQQGTIQHFSFEGGFYGIVTNEGKKLLPMNLPEDFQKTGLKIRLKGRLITDMMTMNQWGSPFKIIEISSVDK